MEYNNYKTVSVSKEAARDLKRWVVIDAKDQIVVNDVSFDVRAGEIVQTFSHTRPDGFSWSTVSGAAYGENIAKGQNSAEKVIASWMTSQGHRENILHGSYGSIGVCARVENGVVYWVQLFGK